MPNSCFQFVIFQFFIIHSVCRPIALGNMQTSEEQLKITVAAKFGAQTKWIKDNWEKEKMYCENEKYEIVWMKCWMSSKRKALLKTYFPHEGSWRLCGKHVKEFRCWFSYRQNHGRYFFSEYIFLYLLFERRSAFLETCFTFESGLTV